ncbi:hypothetical protein Tco_0852662, partial [Tanacetum coccineum]
MTVDQFAPMVVFRIATMDLASYGVGFKREGDGFRVMGTVTEVERDRGEGIVELAGKGSFWDMAISVLKSYGLYCK